MPNVAYPAAIATGIIIGAILGPIVGGRILDRAYAYECRPANVIVELGDSPWTIADTYCSGNLGAATDAIVETYPELHPGQQVTLP